MIKKRMVLALALCLALIASLISGCGGTEQNPNAEYTVSFSYNYFTFDEVPARQTVKYGGKVTKPADPVREGYEFLGWFTDEDSTKEWDFGKDTVTGRLVLYAGWAVDIRGEIVYPDDDKDFSSLTTPGSQEAAYEYKTFFLPEKDGTRQPYVGDLMPYYEDGVYYFYYLKDGGDSYNHSVYLVTTRDFLTYEEQQEPVLESSRSGGAQDNWIGTGSVVKVNGTYYFFYTGHNGSSTMEYQEKIMVARSDNLTSFEKVAGWEIVPDPARATGADGAPSAAAGGEPAPVVVSALNDLALTRGALGEMIEVEITVSGHRIDKLRGDGIVVSTATGSTGYALSAGGPIVSPDYAGMVCVPIAPHTIQARAFLTSPSDVVELALDYDRPAHASVQVDGQVIDTHGDIARVLVRRGRADVLLLDYGPESFYSSVSRVFYGVRRDDR